LGPVLSSKRNKRTSFEVLGVFFARCDVEYY
jgi:hypothetical protein